MSNLTSGKCLINEEVFLKSPSCFYLNIKALLLAQPLEVSILLVVSTHFYLWLNLGSVSGKEHFVVVLLCFSLAN